MMLCDPNPEEVVMTRQLADWHQIVFLIAAAAFATLGIFNILDQSNEPYFIPIALVTAILRQRTTLGLTAAGGVGRN